MDQAQIEVQVRGSLAEVAPRDWDACACPETIDGGRPLDPFGEEELRTLVSEEVAESGR